MTLDDIAAAARVNVSTLKRLRHRSWLAGATAAEILAVVVDSMEPVAPGDDLDEVVVERVLAGDRVDLTDAELVAVFQAARARRIPISRLSNGLGVNYLAAQRMARGEMPARMAARARRATHRRVA
ncbi:hypothetical protein [Actinoplanes missouriensis]|nr:hypothetical protein [Actinoplanes missouriensis]